MTWEGNLARGEGSLTAASSGAFAALPYSLPTRVGTPEGKTSPEELLAAAHGGCFAMSLAGELTAAGTPPERLDVRVRSSSTRSTAGMSSCFSQRGREGACARDRRRRVRSCRPGGRRGLHDLGARCAPGARSTSTRASTRRVQLRPPKPTRLTMRDSALVPVRAARRFALRLTPGRVARLGPGALLLLALGVFLAMDDGHERVLVLIFALAAWCFSVARLVAGRRRLERVFDATLDGVAITQDGRFVLLEPVARTAPRPAVDGRAHRTDADRVCRAEFPGRGLSSRGDRQRGDLRGGDPPGGRHHDRRRGAWPEVLLAGPARPADRDP